MPFRSSGIPGGWCGRGQCTERQYFELFKHHRVQIKVLETEGGRSAPRAVLDRLQEYRRQYEIGAGDQLWLVSDVDRWTDDDLASVAREAARGWFGLAISNPSFELWLYLHVGDMEALGERVTQRGLEAAIRRVKGRFAKERLWVEDFSPGVDAAVERARGLDVEPALRWPTGPGTRVYRVVEAVLALMGRKRFA